MTARDDALAIYHAAVAGALPGPATALALRGSTVGDHELLDSLRGAAHVWIIALGKAAPQMAAAACDALRGIADVSGGAIVSTHRPAPPLPVIEALRGDHPLPGPRSSEAAQWLGDLAARVRELDVVLVLLSGGTSSLIGAPVDGVSEGDYRLLCERLLASGLDIAAMNGVRKRFSRWGAGRLAAALAPARVVCLAISDVPGDDLAAIGSGPCVPDVLTAADVRRLARDAAVALPPTCGAYLARVERGEVRETSKPDDRLLARAEARVIGGAASAVDAARHAAALRGYEPRAHDEPVVGDAAAAGRRLAASLLGASPGAPACFAWHGETTVRLGADPPAGGRCQQLALAAAEVLRGATREIVLLAAGTDGRDGTTDAAGAVADGGTWDAIVRAGIDPAEALARHDAHRALDAVGALIRTGPTGTNVGDLMIGVVGPR